MTTFGERLRRLRLEAGLSQTELAGDGISPSYVSLLESGKRSPSTEVAAQLARKLGCSTSLLLEGEPSDDERRVELAMAYGRLALERGEAEEARRRLQEILELDGVPLAVRDEALLLVARAHLRLGDFDEAVALLLPLFQRVRNGASPLPLPVVGMTLTWLYVHAGSAQQAVALGEEAMAACRDLGLAGSEDYFRLGATLMLAYAELGDDVHASAWAAQLIADAEAAGARGGQAALYWNAAIIAERRGRVDEALHLCQRAMAHLGELDDSVDLARVSVAAAVILLGASPPRTAEALRALDRTKQLLLDLGAAADLAEWEFARSWAALLLQDISGAEVFARSSVERLSSVVDTEAPLPGRSYMALGDSLLAQDAVAEALASYAAAGESVERRARGRAAAYAWRELAERLHHVGDTDGAAEAFRKALDAAAVRDRSSAVLAAIEEARTGRPAGPRRVPLAPVARRAATPGTAPPAAQEQVKPTAVRS